MNDDQGPGWRCQRSISATGSLVYQRPSGARRGRNAVKAKMLLQLLEAVCTSCIGFVLKLPCFVRGIFLCHELLSAGAVMPEPGRFISVMAVASMAGRFSR